MRVLAVTVVHTPLDARIHRRQVRTLLDHGHDVVLAAPFSGHGVAPGAVDDRLRVVDLPRARQWRRLHALVSARRLLARQARDTDVAILHDPELLLAAVGLPAALPVIWDVHEDLAASFGDKPWVPAPLRRALAAMARGVERGVEGRVQVLLAEEGYASRFRGTHPVVPNFPPLPPAPRGPLDDRVVYVGRVSRLRGALELVEAGRRLAPHGLAVDVVGPVDADVAAPLERAAAAGWLRLHGFLANDAALALADGALAGLSLLHDHANYRHSMPTKVLEYQALGIPVVTTPLPAALGVVRRSGSGVVVEFGDVAGLVETILALHADRAWATSLGRAGRADAEGGRSWEAVAPRFLAAVEAAARAS